MARPRPAAPRVRGRGVGLVLATIVALLGAGPVAGATPPTPPGPDDGLGYFHALSPTRVTDTRPGSPIGPAASLAVKVAGVAGVPATAVAVVINVTAIAPTRGTYLTVYPSGEPRPTASNLNVPAGATIANLVVAKIGSDGRIRIYNDAGRTDIAIDVAGWYDDILRPFPGPHADGSRFTPISPFRVRDTRTGGSPIPPGGSIAIDVTGVGPAGGMVPASGVLAVALNITGVSPTRATYLTAYPDGETRPLASNLNLPVRATAPNMAIVKVGANGNIRIYNRSGSTHVVVDIAGWFGPAPDTLAGGEFTANSPIRLVDTRHGSPLGPGATATLTVAGSAALPRAGVAAVVLNVTAVQPTKSTYLTVHPSGETRPLASNLNVAAGATRPNLVIVKVGSDGRIRFYNQSGSVDVVVDVLGWYVRDGGADDAPFDDGNGPAATDPSSPLAGGAGHTAAGGLPAATYANPRSVAEDRAFWTAKRIAEVQASAVPMAVPLRSEPDDGPDITSVGSGRELWLHDHAYFDEGDQHPEVGRLAFRIPTSHTDVRGAFVPAGLYTCSGTLVARNLVLTAAHCVVSRTSGGDNVWFDQFLFLPGQYAGATPNGEWTSWEATWTPGDDDGPYYTRAINGEDGQVGQFWPGDYAFLEFGEQDGQLPGDAGYLPMAVPPWGTWVQDVGYPRSGGFSTYCTSGSTSAGSCYPFYTWTYFQESLEHAAGWWEVGVGSWMTGGSSGGPMLAVQDEQLVVSSVNSNGMAWSDGGVTWGLNMWGPWFNSVTFDIYDGIATP